MTAGDGEGRHLSVVVLNAARPLLWHCFAATGNGRGLMMLDRAPCVLTSRSCGSGDAVCAVDPVVLWIANLQRATALEPRLPSAGCRDVAVLVDLRLEAPVVARGRVLVGAESPELDDGDALGLPVAKQETCRACALSRRRDRLFATALLAVAGVRGLVAADPNGVELADALLALLIDDDDADDIVLTCDERPEDAIAGVLTEECVAELLLASLDVRFSSSRRVRASCIIIAKCMNASRANGKHGIMFN